MKVNKKLIPIKLHFFFFNGAMGPILPFIPVLCRQFGFSALLAGIVQAVLPLLHMVAKPIFGYLLDYFQKLRKLLFILIVVSTTVLYTVLVLIPIPEHDELNITCSELVMCDTYHRGFTKSEKLCHIDCPDYKSLLEMHRTENCAMTKFVCKTPNANCSLFCIPTVFSAQLSLNFLMFILCLALGNIAYTVSNSLSDTICFDVLGPENANDFGIQRVWGSVSFGLSALLGVYFLELPNHLSTSQHLPALYVALIFTAFDLFCCLKLKLPNLLKSENIYKDTLHLLKKKHVSLFIMFTIFVGICDSIIIFYLFWHLEGLAIEADSNINIRLLEGYTVAVETLVGEIVFFYYGGKIIEKLGHSLCFTMCFGLYSFRFALIALIDWPWYILPIEAIFQGPTFALLYSTVVVYANALAPPGTTATVQGLVGGMDDGFGYALGSLIGGVILFYFGGKMLFCTASLFSLFCCILHLLLNTTIKKHHNADILSRGSSSPLRERILALNKGAKPKVVDTNEEEKTKFTQSRSPKSTSNSPMMQTKQYDAENDEKQHLNRKEKEQSNL